MTHFDAFGDFPRSYVHMSIYNIIYACARAAHAHARTSSRDGTCPCARASNTVLYVAMKFHADPLHAQLGPGPMTSRSRTFI